MILREGRTGEERRLWEPQGITVSRLSRVCYVPICLRQDLRRGRWAPLEAVEIVQVLELAGMTSEPGVWQGSVSSMNTVPDSPSPQYLAFSWHRMCLL